MAGSVVDLSTPDIPLPGSMVLDSSVVIDWLGATSLAVMTAPPPTSVQVRAAQLIARLQRERTVGAVTATSLAEVFHFVLKTAYR